MPSVVRNITFQAQGGFAEVLDPKRTSAYKIIHTNCFHLQSVNAKSFRGGMFIDGYAGNVEMAVTGVNTAFSIEVILAGTGLFLRKRNVASLYQWSKISKLRQRKL